MKKVLSTSKLSSPSKLVRKVLSRTTSISTSSREENKNSQPQTSTSKDGKDGNDSEALDLELSNLKEQLSMLQLAVNSMQEDAEKRETAMAHMAREKQQLSIALRKERRSISSLKQQLQDEREFYYKEKEQYCQEMNDCKKLKKKMSENVEILKQEVSVEESAEIIQYKNRLSKLQEALNQTLEANYNLSVKFMRMKNTKTNLKNTLKQQENDHKQALQKLQIRVNNIKNDLAEVIDKRFALPISPSNKKYLQIVKQNGILLHENLYLQMEVDRLSTEVRHYKFLHSHKETKRKSKQLQDSPQDKGDQKQTASIETAKDPPSKGKTKSIAQLKYHTEKPQTSTAPTKNVKKLTTLKDYDSDTNVITIFERKVSRTPCTIVTPQDSKEINVSLPKITEEKPKSETTVSPRNCPVHQILSEQKVETPSHVSESSDFTYASSSRETLRTQSAPEIVQTSLFISKHKP